MASTPDKTNSRQNDASTRTTARDSHEGLLSSNIQSSIPHPRHPVASAKRHRREDSSTGLFSFFSDSTSSLRAKPDLQQNNQSSEAMLNSNYRPTHHHDFHHHTDRNTTDSKDLKDTTMESVESEKLSNWAVVREHLKCFIMSPFKKRIKLAPRRRAVANVAFADALHTEKPSPWGKGMLKLYFFLFIAVLNSLTNGYDASLMGGINNMDYYRDYFSIKGKTGQTTGFIFSVFAIGNICGSFFCGPLSDLWGRRWGMFHGAVILIVGSCIQGFAYSGPNHDKKDMFVLGRFLLGFGTATCQTAGPSYVAEMAHPAWRGVLTGLYNCSFFVGGLAATWIMYRTQKIESTISWRLPTWLACAPAACIMIGCIFIPETPRWLFSNDQQEEAIRVLTKYHGAGRRRSPIVILTLREMIDRILIEGSDKRWWDYSDLFNSKAAWWRLSCIAGMAFFGQWSGNAFVTYFMPVLLEHVGIDDPSTQLLYNAILNLLQLLVSISGAFCVDYFGRRPVLLYSTTLFIIWWAIITALMNTVPLQHREQEGGQEPMVIHGSKAAIAMIYLFALTYSFSYTPLQILYPVECLSYETRAKGMGIYNLLVNVAAVFNTYGVSTIVDKIGANWYYVYVIWNFCEVIYIWFFFVETKGRTLEEISEIFEAPYPKEKSLQRHVVEETDVGLLYRGLMNELQDMEGVVAGAPPPVQPNPNILPHPGTVYNYRRSAV